MSFAPDKTRPVSRWRRVRGLCVVLMGVACLVAPFLLGKSALSLIGALILITLANGFNILNLGANYQGLIQGVVLIVAAGMYTVALRRRQSMKLRTTAPATSDTAAGSDAEHEADLVTTGASDQR